MCSYRLCIAVILVFVSSTIAKPADLKHDDGNVRIIRSLFKEVNGKFGFVNFHPNLQPEEPAYYPQGYPQIYLHWYPNGNPQGFPQWYPNGNPEGDPQGVPQGRPQGNPQGGPPEYIPDETESFDPAVGPRVRQTANINPFEVEDLDGEDFSRYNDLDRVIDLNSFL